MPLNRNTLMRLRTIDACLCRRQRRWTLEDLRTACEAALYEYEGITSVSKRTIQRDIELMRSGKLGYNAPIIVMENRYYTYEDPDFSITQLPLSKQDISELSAAMEIIRHYGGFRDMAGQEDILARIQDKIQSSESHRQVVFIDTNNRLKGLDFLSVLYDHIIRKDAIEVIYQSFKARRPTCLFISPYLLKEYNNRWFLVGYNHKKHDIQTIALDRIFKVVRSSRTPYKENTFFEPEQYLDDMVGVTRDIDSSPQEITIIIDSDQAPYVLTKPIHHSQQLIRENNDGSIVIMLNVIPNHELERVILGYGRHIEVVSPPEIRRHIANHVKTSASFYKDADAKA